jgi:hypothetical protein
MAKKLVIIRNERSTYEVQIEHGDPPRRAFGGISLDRDRLRTELLQHGCPEEVAANAIKEVESKGSAHVAL